MRFAERSSTSSPGGSRRGLGAASGGLPQKGSLSPVENGKFPEGAPKLAGPAAGRVLSDLGVNGILLSLFEVFSPPHYL